MKNFSYQDTIGTIVFDQDNRMPLWVVDDLVINPDNLKIESLIIKNSFFKKPKILNTSSIPSWWKDIFVPSYSIKEIEKTIITKTILEKEIWIIWNKVENERWDKIWIVTDLFYTKNTFQWISIFVKPYLLWLIPIWKWREISRKNIIDVNQNKIIIKDVNLANNTA